MKLARVLMEIKAHAALSPADTHAHLFWMCHLSVWPWSSDHHVRGQGQGYWQALWRIPHLCPTIPAGRAGALLPSRVPSHPNRRGLEAGGCIPHAGSSKSCVGHSSVQGSWSGQEVAPGDETPEASLKDAALGRRPLAARPGAPCAAAARNLHSAGRPMHRPCLQPALVWGSGSWRGKRVLVDRRPGCAGWPLSEHALRFPEIKNAFVFFQLKVLFWNDFTFTEKLQNSARAPMCPAPVPTWTSCSPTCVAQLSTQHCHVISNNTSSFLGIPPVFPLTSYFYCGIRSRVPHHAYRLFISFFLLC